MHKAMKPMTVFTSCSRMPPPQIVLCLKSTTADVLSPDEHLSQILCPTVVTSRRIVALFDTFLSGYA
jgi:hypothetical protein